MPMTRDQFHGVVVLAGKRIVGDLEYYLDAAKEPLVRLKTMQLQGTGEYAIKLDGWYNPLHDSFSFTFSCAEAGGKPICRADVRGIEHDEGGRTHKHELRTEKCPDRNLPTRIEKAEWATMTPREVWRDLCQIANIVHDGQFIDPPPPLYP